MLLVSCVRLSSGLIIISAPKVDNDGELHNDLSLWFHTPPDSDSVSVSLVSVWLRRLGN